MEHILYWLWLTGVFGVKAGRFLPQIKASGGIKAFYEREEYPDINTKSALDKLKNKSLTWAKVVYNTCERQGIEIIDYNSLDYPEILKTINVPPVILYAKGEIPDWEELFMIGVVGTRTTTDYGIKITTEFCTELSKRGVTIVTGVAKGIDTAAVKSATDAGGRVISVCPCGVDVKYPKANYDIMSKVTDNGIRLSEYPPGVGVRREHFRDRNRIIAGLSLGTLVTEAPENSGALITAHHAVDENRDVFVVTGKINDTNTKGINKLIKEGAKPVFSADDIISEYPYFLNKLIPVQKAEEISENTDNQITRDGTEGEILKLLTKRGPTHIDELMRSINVTPNAFQTSVFMLEMDGEILRMPGNILKRLK